MRACRVLVVAAIGVVLSACAVVPSRMLRADEQVLPGRAAEGYLVLVGHVPSPMQLSAYLCQDGDLNRCLRVGPQRTEDGLRVRIRGTERLFNGRSRSISVPLALLFGLTAR